MVLSYAVTDYLNEPRKVFDQASPETSQVLLVDISCSYLKAVTPEDDPTNVELPPELGAPPGTHAFFFKSTCMEFAERRTAGRASAPVL